MTFNDIFNLMRKIINEESGLNYTNEELAHYLNLTMILAVYENKEIARKLREYSILSSGSDLPTDFLHPEDCHDSDYSFPYSELGNIPFYKYFVDYPVAYLLGEKIYFVNASSAMLAYIGNPLFFTFDSGPGDPPTGYSNTLTDTPTIPEEFHEFIARGAAALALMRDNSVAQDYGVQLYREFAEALGLKEEEKSEAGK